MQKGYLFISREGTRGLKFIMLTFAKKSRGCIEIESLSPFFCIPGQCALAMNVNCQRDQDDKFLKMVRASLDRQIDSTVIMASCFPLVENIIAWIFSKRGRKHTNQVIIEKCR